MFSGYDAVDVSQKKKTDGDDVESGPSRASISLDDADAAIQSLGSGEGSNGLFNLQFLYKPAMLAAYAAVRISAMNRNDSIYFRNIGYQVPTQTSPRNRMRSCAVVKF